MNVSSASHSCEHNAFNFVNAHFTRVCCGYKECTLIKLLGLLLITMAGRNDIHSGLYKVALKKKTEPHTSRNMWMQ